MAEDRRWVVITVMSALLCCALPALFMRVYVRARVVKKFGGDDWAMVGAGLLNAVYLSLQTSACVNGFGAHISDLTSVTTVYSWGSAPNGDVSAALRFWYLTTIFFVITSCAVRVAVCLLLFKTDGLQQRRGTIISIMVLSIILAGAMIMLLIFQCGTDTDDYWSAIRSKPAKYCLKPGILTGVWYAFTASTLVVDLGIAALVAVLLFARGNTVNRRCMFVGLELTTLLAIAPSALSILYIPGLKDTSDLTFSATNFSITLLIPPSIGIIAASLATLDPWLKELGVLTARPSYSIKWQQQAGRRVPRQPTPAPEAMMTGRQQGGRAGNGRVGGRARVRFEEHDEEDDEDEEGEEERVEASGALRADSAERAGESAGEEPSRTGSGSQAGRETPVPEGSVAGGSVAGGSVAGTENSEQQLVSGGEVGSAV